MSSVKTICISLILLLIIFRCNSSNDSSITGTINADNNMGDLTVRIERDLWRNHGDDLLKFTLGENLNFSSTISPGKYKFKVLSNNINVFETNIIVNKRSEIQISLDLKTEPYNFNIKGFELYDEYNQLIKDLENYDKNWRKTRSTTNNEERNRWCTVSDSVRFILNEIESKYDKFFQPIFIERKIYYLTKFHPIYKDIVDLYQQGLFENNKVQFYSSKEYQDYFNDMIELLESLDYKSHLLNGKFFGGILRTHWASDTSPILSENLNLPADYFYKLLKNSSEVSQIVEIRAESLYKLAEHYIDRGKFTKGRNSLEILQTDYPDASFIKNGQVIRMLASIKTTPGYVAPELNIQLTTGENYRLSEQKGKFVLVDFWGTWCGACIVSIPYINNLSKEISKDSLKVIGIANDDSTRLANFLNEQKINYVNALSNKKLLDQWGILGFPTTLLISPDGKIYKQNINIGNNIVNEIRKLMAHYYGKNGV
ncbi:TlpA family protein disulfide reductase [candidate division KSB1 bacterium]|nr:TlpA family protein disulfide reductase [candidate division KSB1 bacterium]